MESTQQPPADPVPQTEEGGPQLNKLQDSHEAKQGASYYYAHRNNPMADNDAVKKHFEAEGAVQGGEPALLAKLEEKKKSENYILIKTFSFADAESETEGNPKLYIELGQMTKIRKVTKEMVTVNIEERSIEVHVNDGKGVHYNLAFDLFKAVDAPACTWRFSAGKRISVTFKKVDRAQKWWNVRKP